jgi:hypothetical protein
MNKRACVRTRLTQAHFAEPSYAVPFLLVAVPATVSVTIMTMTMSELENVEQIADGRAVERHVGIIWVRNRIREIIAAPRRQGLQVPIALDELQDRDVIGIRVVHMPALGKRRNDNQRDAGTVAEEIEWLNVTGIVIATALVQRDDKRCAGE